MINIKNIDGNEMYFEDIVLCYLETIIQKLEKIEKENCNDFMNEGKK